jgi:hypothetical protein
LLEAVWEGFLEEEEFYWKQDLKMGKWLVQRHRREDARWAQRGYPRPVAPLLSEPWGLLQRLPGHVCW